MYVVPILQGFLLLVRLLVCVCVCVCVFVCACVWCAGIYSASSVGKVLSALESSSWLKHIHLILETSVFIAKVSKPG